MGLVKKAHFIAYLGKTEVFQLVFEVDGRIEPNYSDIGLWVHTEIMLEQPLYLFVVHVKTGGKRIETQFAPFLFDVFHQRNKEKIVRVCIQLGNAFQQKIFNNRYFLLNKRFVQNTLLEFPQSPIHYIIQFNIKVFEIPGAIVQEQGKPFRIYLDPKRLGLTGRIVIVDRSGFLAKETGPFQGDGWSLGGHISFDGILGINKKKSKGAIRDHKIRDVLVHQ